MSAALRSPRLHLLVRLALGLVFVYASLDKIANPADFALIVKNYRLLPFDAINLVAVLLPWVELVAGLLLIFGLVTRGSSLLISVLLAVFIVALGINVSRGLDINCGCFSTSIFILAFSTPVCCLIACCTFSSNSAFNDS